MSGATTRFPCPRMRATGPLAEGLCERAALLVVRHQQSLGAAAIADLPHRDFLRQERDVLRHELQIPLSTAATYRDDVILFQCRQCRLRATASPRIRISSRAFGPLKVRASSVTPALLYCRASARQSSAVPASENAAG